MRSLLVLLFSLIPAFAEQQLPNILWITSEDNSAYWLGCYGNEQARTPRLDALAEEGLRFEYAYSNAPVCAVARSMILNGAHAVTMGTQHMRSRHRIPARYRPHVSYLKEKGYYCTNASKTDYNFLGNDRAIWDECSNKAHYRNRPDGTPFFAIINLTTTHESQLFPDKNPDGPKRLKPAEVEVPGHLPDLPEVRSDISRYHDRMTLLDSQIGKILDDLEKAGLADDTVVFYYGDHGGPTPRGKRYIKETGVRIPMLVRVPEKWQGLSPFKAGEVVRETVGFVDLAPTLLSIIGIERPRQMQGRPFLGKHRMEPAEDEMVFLQADRFDELYGMRRGLTNGRWKYIRRFTPHKPAAPYSSYQFSMPSWVAWRKVWQEGKLEGRHAEIWEVPQPTEELFDLAADPWEMRNLAADPKQSDRLKEMRGRLETRMGLLHDTGVIPEAFFDELAGDGTIADFAASSEFDPEEIVACAIAATGTAVPDEQHLRATLEDGGLLQRYWAAQGVLIHHSRLEQPGDLAQICLKDGNAVLRMIGGEILCASGNRKAGAKALLGELSKPDNRDYTILYLMNALRGQGLEERVPKSWARKVLKGRKTNDYVKRFALDILGKD